MVELPTAFQSTMNISVLGLIGVRFNNNVLQLLPADIAEHENGYEQNYIDDIRHQKINLPFLALSFRGLLP